MEKTAEMYDHKAQASRRQAQKFQAFFLGTCNMLGRYAAEGCFQ